MDDDDDMYKCNFFSHVIGSCHNGVSSPKSHIY